MSAIIHTICIISFSMKSNELIKKYEVLYKSGVETAVFLGLANECDFIGCSDEEILMSEAEDGIDYPASVCAYLQTFGVFCNLQDQDYNIGSKYSQFKITRELLSMKSNWTNSKTIKDYLKEQDFSVNFEELNPIPGEYTPKLSEIMNLDKINIFMIELSTNIYHFYDSSTDNPEIFYYILNKGVVSNFVSVTDTYRRSIFHFLCKYAPYGYKYQNQINRDTPKALFDTPCPPEKEWLRFYSEWFQDSTFQKNNELNRLRDAYYMINQKQEKNENRILTLDEFETNFIQFLKTRL